MLSFSKFFALIILGMAVAMAGVPAETYAKEFRKQTFVVNPSINYSEMDISEFSVFSDDEISGSPVFLDVTFKLAVTSARFCENRSIRFSIDGDQDGDEDFYIPICETGVIASEVKAANGVATGCRVEGLVSPAKDSAILHLAIPAFCQEFKFYDLSDFGLSALYTKGGVETRPLGTWWPVADLFRRGGFSPAIGQVYIADSQGDVPAKSAKFMDVLKADTYNWESGSKLSYKWGRFAWGGRFEANSGGTYSSYKVSANDIGSRIYLQVCARQSGMETACKYASISNIKAISLKKKPLPVVLGNPYVGQKLTGKTGVWEAGVSLKVSWLRNGIPIKGQSAREYRVTKFDKGKKITFRVTATKPGFYTEVKTSVNQSSIR